MKKIYVFVVIILLTGGLNANSFYNQKVCEKAYAVQVEVNDAITKEYDKLEEHNKKMLSQFMQCKAEAIRDIARLKNDNTLKKREIERLKKERDKATDWLVKIPFVDIGITVNFAQGIVAGAILSLMVI